MSDFNSEKKRVLKEYNLALEQNRIDKKVISILNIINSHNDYYSTSSCSGRTLLLELARPGAKAESNILGKWHNITCISEVKKCLSSWKKYPYLYFFAQSPIFHITTNNLTSAIYLRNLGETAGFKYSSIRSIKSFGQENDLKKVSQLNLANRITVELLSTERLNLPLGQNYKLFVDDKYLEFILEQGNHAISESDKKLSRLEEILNIELYK